jgi:ubiquinone/menaquinone biosynthesis C-methylase UbiE
MATVYMKWLETNPRQYERGIQLLTLGQIRQIQLKIRQDYTQPGLQVLEIGCGTGRLAVQMAMQGAFVTAIDASPAMLTEAQKISQSVQPTENLTLMRLEASQLAERFAPGSFDLVVASLVFSELPEDERRLVLLMVRRLLKPDGRLLLVDETIPGVGLRRWLYWLVRLPLVLLTWLLTRATTQPLHNPGEMLASAGWDLRQVLSYLGGSLTLMVCTPCADFTGASPMPKVHTLRHRVTLRTRFLDLWELFFRIIPPYPKVTPGLYAIGQPDADSPVLVTGNYDLTVRRLAEALVGNVQAWVLVCDSAGINVWCGAGGGFFSAEKIIAGLHTSQLERLVQHRQLILPQLCANGVDGWQIRKETGWQVRWGPLYAGDIPAYLSAGLKKTDFMRQIQFPMKERLEMVMVTLSFYALLILIPVLIFWREQFLPITASLLGLSFFYAIFLPWLPGKDGLLKSIPLALISLAGLTLYTLVLGTLTPLQFYHWAIGQVGLSVLVAAEMQGMSPLMRGEQANWTWEALIGVVLALAYFLLPLVLGWKG